MYDMFFDLANSAASQFESVLQDSRFLRQNSAQVHSEVRVEPPNHQVKAPPASRKAIRNLAVVQVTADDLIEESNKECLICLDDQRIGSYACKLACGHMYHKTCLTEWLQKSCTCPVCRYELETEDAAYENERKSRMLKRKMRFRLDELRSKKVNQLREIASSLVVNLAGCVDKGDIIENLLASGMIELIEGAPAILKTQAEFEAMGVGELRCCLLSFGLSDQGALEKGDLRSRLLNSGRIVLKDVPMTSCDSSSGYGGAARSDVVRNLNSYLYSSEQSDPNFDNERKTNDSANDSYNNRQNYSYEQSKSPGTSTVPNVAPVSSVPKSDSATDLKNMSVSELKALCGSLNVSLMHCLYKEDIIERLLASGKFKC